MGAGKGNKSNFNHSYIKKILDLLNSISSGSSAGATEATLLLIKNLIIALSKEEDAVHNSGDTGVQMLAVRKDSAGSFVNLDGDYSPLQVDNIGSLRTFDILTLGALNGVIKVADSTYVPSNNGIAAFAVRNDAGSPLAADGEYTPLMVNAYGYLSTNLKTIRDAVVAIGSGNADPGTQRVSISTDDINLAAIKTALEVIDNVVDTIGGVDVNKVALFDSAGVQIDSFGGGGSSAGGGNNTYSTYQQDFTTTYASATTFTLDVDSIGGDSITLDNFAGAILKVYDLSALEFKTIVLDKPTWTFATKTIDISACTDTFALAAGDTISLTLLGRDKSYDNATDEIKVSVSNPDYAHYTGSEHPIDIGITDTVNTTSNYVALYPEGYRSQILQILASDAGTMNVYLYATLDDTAAIPAAGATQGSSWHDITTEVFGGAVSGVTIDKILNFDTLSMPDRYLLKYVPSAATGVASIDVWFKKF